ncbi:MAG: class I SAM-dependent methyltransferase [Patescibacteria group bacterium]
MKNNIDYSKFDRKSQTAFWWRNEWQFKGVYSAAAIFGLIKCYIGEKIIETGSGDGALAKFIKEKKSNVCVMATDLAPKTEFIQRADCTNLVFKDNSFDTYISTDLIEHLNDKDLSSCIREACRVVKKGGTIIFSTVNDEILSRSMIVCPYCNKKYHWWGHCQVFDEERLNTIAKENNLEIERVFKTNLWFLARYPIFSKIFYFLLLDKILNFQPMTADILVVYKKS